ncbi:MAG: polysaccharide biosynthesis tyrosine autokinase [Verrucomicrobia bacterium]|nr:polysaccharide biosynthesis tyrosine autokinase [Verrucomicrobiota bacterium]
MPEETKIHFLDYWRVIKLRKAIILSVFLLVLLTAAAVTFSLPRIYYANVRMRVERERPTVAIFEANAAAGFDPIFQMDQVEILQSQKIGYRVVDKEQLVAKWAISGPESAAKEQAFQILRGRLKVMPVRNSSLIEVGFFSTDPVEAADLANAMGIIYRDSRLEEPMIQIEMGLEKLREEYNAQHKLVETAQQKVNDLRKDLNLDILSNRSRLNEETIQRLHGDRSGAMIAMLVDKTRADQINKLTNAELKRASQQIVGDPQVSSLQTALQNAELQLVKLLQTYGPEHPTVKDATATQKKLDEQLEEAINVMRKSLEIQCEVDRAKVQALEEELRMARVTGAEKEAARYIPFENAQKELEFQVSLRDAIKARVSQESVSIKVPRTAVEIIDQARPSTAPVKPNVPLYLGLAAIAGLALGVMLAFFVEYLDTSVKTIDDVERYLGLPVLGVIPQNVEMLSTVGQDSPHAEAYRVLRANIEFGKKDPQANSITIVSAGAGEGKTTTLFNLAVVCAQNGDKVLVVDSDMRRPTLHKRFGVSNEVGLTDVLMNDVKVEDCIQTTNVPNLYFLPSGKLPKIAIGILKSQKMRDLIQDLKMRYDLVLFDSPPIMGVSDASVLASEVDFAVLVIQYRKYPRAMPARAKQAVENVGGRLIGVVLNSIVMSHDESYYYYNAYYDHYSRSEEATPEAPIEKPAEEAETETKGTY